MPNQRGSSRGAGAAAEAGGGGSAAGGVWGDGWGRWLVGWAGTGVLVLGVFGAMALYLRAVERGLAWTPVAGGGASVAEPPPVAQVDRLVRAMDLVTVVIDTRISVATKEESWRGDVEARVRVPARLLFGTDLSLARVEPAGGATGVPGRDVLVVLPAPRRIATEIFGELEEHDVSTGWLRLRSMSGEYMLGVARKLVSDQARRSVLTAEDQTRVREETRRRVEEVVGVVLGVGGVGPRVLVRFADEVGGAAGEGTAGAAGAPKVEPERGR